MLTFQNIIICLLPIFVSIHLYYALNRNINSLRGNNNQKLIELQKFLEEEQKIITTLEYQKKRISGEVNEINKDLNRKLCKNETSTIKQNIPEKPEYTMIYNKKHGNQSYQLIKLSPNEIWFLINSKIVKNSYFGSSSYFLNYITTLHTYTIISKGMEGYEIQQKLLKKENNSTMDLFFFNINALVSENDRRIFYQFMKENYVKINKSYNVWFFKNGMEVSNELAEVL